MPGYASFAPGRPSKSDSLNRAGRARSTGAGTALVRHTAEFIASVEGQERGCVDGAQMSGPPVPDDDGLHAMDSVHADDFGVRHHCKLTVRCLCPSPQVASK